MLILDTGGMCSVSELGVLLAGCVGDCPGLVTGSMSPQVLHCCINGSSTYTQQNHYVLSLADLSSSDYDPFLPLGNVRSSSERAQCPSSTDLGNLLTVAEGEGVPRVWAGPAYMCSSGKQCSRFYLCLGNVLLLTACSNCSFKIEHGSLWMNSSCFCDRMFEFIANAAP